MSGDVSALSVDVATYVGAVAAGVSVNGLSSAARGLVDRVREKLHLQASDEKQLLTVTPALVHAVDALLRDDEELRTQAEITMGTVMIDRSIIIHGQHVSGVTQHNY